MKVILLTIILSCSSVGLTALKAAISEQVPAESSVEAPRPEGTGQDQVRQAKAGPEKDTAALDSLAVMDSLATAADSLARAVDSLETLLDSIVHSKEKAEKEARAKAAEKKRKVKKRLWNGTLGMGLTQNRGNDSQSSFITTLRINRKGSKTSFSNRASITNAKSDNGKRTNKGYFKSKVEVKHSKRLFFFSRLDLDYNKQAGIDLRLSPGLGMGIVLINNRKLGLDLNFGANPITEYLRDMPVQTKGYYLASQELRVAFSKSIKLEQGLTYKPKFDQVNDYLVNFNLSLTNKLTSDFDLKVNIEGQYDSRPPERDPPYKRQDWMFYTAISYSFW